MTNKKHSKEKNLWKLISEDQMQIDAGQKLFGATQCSECGLVYQIGEPDDEIQHNLYHSNHQTLHHSVRYLIYTFHCVVFWFFCGVEIICINFF